MNEKNEEYLVIYLGSILVFKRKKEMIRVKHETQSSSSSSWAPVVLKNVFQ